MRPAYQPCGKHGRTYCCDTECKAEETSTGDSILDTIRSTTDTAMDLLIGPLSPISTMPDC